jgi:hypothetical protein
MPASGGNPPWINRQINYKARIFVKTTSDINGTPTNYGNSPYINFVTHNIEEFPSIYSKTVDVPTSGYFNVQILMEWTECSTFNKMKEYEGVSPITQLPTATIYVDNVVEIWSGNC